MLPIIRVEQTQQQLFMQSKPKFSKSEISMRITGVSLILLSGLLFSGSIVLARKFHPLIGGCFILGIPALAPGIYCTVKSYWDDPSFVKRMANKHRHLDFEELIAKFTLDKVYTKMYDKATLSQKFEEYGKNSTLSFWELNRYSQFNFYSNEIVRNIFIHRLQQSSLSQLLLQPDGEKNVQALIQYNIITQADLRSQFLAESQGMNLSNVLASFTWSIFTLNIADPRNYQQAIINEMDNLQGPLDNFINRYSEKVVTLGILPHTHPVLKSKFLEMMRRLPFSQIPSSLFDEKYGLVPEYLRDDVNGLLRKAAEIGCWNSRETHAARERYYRTDNNRTISFEYNYTYDNHTGSFHDVVRYGTRDNPHYFSRHRYEDEVNQDANQRRPARIQAEVDAPWQTLFSKTCQKIP